MAKIHLPPEHPKKELSPEEKALLEEINRADEKATIAAALAKVLPAKDPDKAKLEQIVDSHAAIKAEKEAELAKAKGR